MQEIKSCSPLQLFAEAGADDPHTLEGVLLSLSGQVKVEGQEGLTQRQLHQQRLQAWTAVLEVSEWYCSIKFILIINFI